MTIGCVINSYIRINNIDNWLLSISIIRKKEKKEKKNEILAKNTGTTQKHVTAVKH